jgi:hypothetical protein
VGKRSIALLLAAAALTLIVVGCGGSDEGTNGSETTASLSKAEFIKEGNAICAEGNQAAEAEVEEFLKDKNLPANEAPSEASLVEAVEQVFLPNIRQQLDELRALGVPSGDREQVEEMFEAIEKALQKGEENPNSLLVEGGGPFTEANKLAREYGLDKCGEEG